RATRAALRGLLACLLEPGAKPELQLAGRLLGERERGDRLHGPAPLGENVDEASDQLARLAGARRRLDDQRLVERPPDALPFGLVDERRHGQSLSARSSSIRAWSFSLMRLSSCGPHTSRKSQIPHARARGAGGRKPAAIARSMTPSTSGPRFRASPDSETTRSPNPPARVQ